MNNIYHRETGDSHLQTDKPCQDFAYAQSSDSLSMAIISDGHGGEPYFRSHIGSELAVNITRSALCELVENLPDSFFEDATFTSYSKDSATDEQLKSKQHKQLTWLFSSIISRWNNAIAEDARNRELTDWELNHVNQKYLDAYRDKLNDDNATFEKTYGCTLMAYVQTPDYWFAFHIGDGKCIFMSIDDGKLVCTQPIPWDDKCFLNKTTSLCDSHALEEFRYCYQANGEFPLAVFLGSDGLDDSFGDGEVLNNFYIQLYKQAIKSGNETAFKVLKKSFPIISARGSKDDMSVACVYTDTEDKKVFPILIAYQQAWQHSLVKEAEEKLAACMSKIDSFGNPEKLNQEQQINLGYAQKDKEKAENAVKKAKSRIRELDEELNRFIRGQQKHTQTNHKSNKSQRNLHFKKNKK